MSAAVSPVSIDLRVSDFIARPRQMLIDGRWVNAASGKTFPTYNPAIGFPGSALPGTFAAATTSSGSYFVDAIAANLLLTWVNTGACTATCVNGTQYDAANTGGNQ